MNGLQWRKISVCIHWNILPCLHVIRKWTRLSPMAHIPDKTQFFKRCVVKAFPNPLLNLVEGQILVSVDNARTTECLISTASQTTEFPFTNLTRLALGCIRGFLQVKEDIQVQVSERQIFLNEVILSLVSSISI